MSLHDRTKGRRHSGGTPESPENFHTKSDHTTPRTSSLDRSQNMDREPDIAGAENIKNEMLDPEFDGEDDLGREEDMRPGRTGDEEDGLDDPSIRGI